MMPTSPQPSEADVPPAMTRRRQIGDGALAFGGRLLVLGTGMVTGIGLPLCFDATDVGLFFLAQLLIAGLALVAQLGLTPSVMELVPAELARGNRAWVRATILRMLGVVGAASLCLAALLGGALLVIREWGGAIMGIDEGLWLLAPAVLLTIPLMAMVSMLSEQHRALQAFAEASFLGAAGSLVAAAAIIAALLGILPLTVGGLLILASGGLAVSVLLGGARLHLRIRNWPRQRTPAPRYGDLWATAWPNLITSLMLFLLAQADLWIVALISGPAEVAHYGLGLRLSMLLLFPLATMNAVVVPQASRLWALNHRRELQKLLTVSASLATAAALAGYAALLLIGKPLILRFWGEDYEAVFTLCAILGLAQVAHTFGGSAGTLLLAFGRQRTALRITAGCGSLTIALGILGMMTIGPVGLVSAFAFGILAQTAGFVIAAHRAFGLHTTPLPLSLPAARTACRNLWPKKTG